MPNSASTDAHNSSAATIEHLFVLMLENHSFDCVFAMSGIPGIIRANSGDTNSFGGTTYHISSPAPTSAPADPGHEFQDVLQQLCGPDATHTPWQPYPRPITNTGFVANYAGKRQRIASVSGTAPAPEDFGDVMACFDTPTQLPVIYQLATEFAVCDQWFASVPGPTWPNRFFVHGASSGGWANSPPSASVLRWETFGGGFVYPSGSSIFDALTKAELKWRVYADENGPILGGIPQVSALRGITWQLHTHPFSAFQGDLQNPYPYTYTFIEPNYGDVASGRYTGGSSQHPVDGVGGGEALIKATYEAIRNSPLWNSSLLIVSYDEHGGYYDSVAPGSAPAPADNSPEQLSMNAGGFLFDQYGVRVPAVVVSPLIPRGTVDHTIYDHASIPATLERLHGLPPLTRRDASANTVLGLVSLTTARTDTPSTLKALPPPLGGLLPPAVAQPDLSDQPLPESEPDNIHGFVDILVKTDLELARDDPTRQTAIRQRVSAIKTRADAEAYAAEVRARARAIRAAASPAPAPGTPR
jgi:phospholipase C